MPGITAPNFGYNGRTRAFGSSVDTSSVAKTAVKNLSKPSTDGGSGMAIPLWGYLAAEAIGAGISAFAGRRESSEEKWLNSQVKSWNRVGSYRAGKHNASARTGANRASELFGRINSRYLSADLQTRLKTNAATGGLDGI
jgi:hypothetical protein